MAIESMVVLGLATLFLGALAIYASRHRSEDYEKISDDAPTDAQIAEVNARNAATDKDPVVRSVSITDLIGDGETSDASSRASDREGSPP